MNLYHNCIHSLKIIIHRHIHIMLRPYFNHHGYTYTCAVGKDNNNNNIALPHDDRTCAVGLVTMVTTKAWYIVIRHAQLDSTDSCALEPPSIYLLMLFFHGAMFSKENRRMSFRLFTNFLDCFLIDGSRGAL